MLTGTPIKYATVFVALLLGGLFMGNMVLLYSSVLVLVYLVHGFGINQPEMVNITRLHDDAEVEVDDLFTFRYQIKVDAGVGLIIVGFDVPKHFKLVEGNNLVTIWKKKQPLDIERWFTVRCEKRGTHRTSGAEWETRHPLGFITANLGRVEAPTTITVYPKHYQIRRIRDRKIYSSIPIPTEAIIQTGVPTTNFKDIREYQLGDPFKTINWKATARKTYHQYQPPMVNEYEKEGRKTVWIFMNTASRMQMGTSIRNCFEYAVQAAIELADFYINQNCLLGFSLYNDDYPTGSIGFLRRGGHMFLSQATEVGAAQRYIEVKSLLPPDSGTQQFLRLRRMMMQTTPSSLLPSLPEAIQQARTYTRGSAPLFFIITAIDRDHLTGLTEGLTEINEHTRLRAPQPQAIVVHLLGYELVNTSTQASRLRFIEDTPIINSVRDSAFVVQWNPGRELLSEAVIAQVNR